MMAKSAKQNNEHIFLAFSGENSFGCRSYKIRLLSFIFLLVTSCSCSLDASGARRGK